MSAEEKPKDYEAKQTCHCGLLQKPLWQCPTGKCRKMYQEKPRGRRGKLVY